MKVIECSIQRNIDDHVHLLTSLRARSEVALSVLIVRSLSISFCLSCVMLVFCMQLHWIQREQKQQQWDYCWVAEIWKSPPYVSGYQSHPSFYLALLFYACQEGLKAHLHQNYCWCHHCSHDPPLIQIIPRPFHPQSIKKDHQSQGTSLRTQTSEPVLTLMDQPAIRLWVDHGGRGLSGCLENATQKQDPTQLPKRRRGRRNMSISTARLRPNRCQRQRRRIQSPFDKREDGIAK